MRSRTRNGKSAKKTKKVLCSFSAFWIYKFVVEFVVEMVIATVCIKNYCCTKNYSSRGCLVVVVKGNNFIMGTLRSCGPLRT